MNTPLPVRRRACLLGVLLLVPTIACSTAGREPPRAVAGVLDLRRWNFDSDGVVPLDGDWVLRYGVFQGPELLSTPPSAPFAFEPGSWNRTIQSGHGLPGQGIATHALRVLLPPHHAPSLALSFGEAYAADCLFANGALVSERGRVGAEDEIPDPRPTVVRFVVTGDTLDLVIQISNHFHHDGGLIRTPVLGPTPLIELRLTRQIKEDFFVLGCLGILGLYYGILFATRPEPAHLLFSTLTLLVALRLSTTAWYMNDLFPLGALGQLRLDYVTLFVAPPIYYAFVRALFPDAFSDWILKTATAVAVLGMLASLFLPSVSFTSLLPLAMTVGVLVPVAAFGSLVFAAIRRKDGALPLVLGAFFVVVVLAHDAWARAGFLASQWNALALASLCLVFAHAAVLGVRLSRTLALSETLRSSLEELNRNLEQRIAERTAMLEQVAGTDPLTGVHNRRSLTRLAEAERSAAHRQQHDFSVAIIDVDHFKSVNDSQGHATGDLVLSRLAAELTGRVRGHDVIGRYGGDEFVVVLPYLGDNEAVVAAERLRQELGKVALEGPDGKTFHATVSVGVATAGRDETFEALLRRADEALYAAKTGGRNRVARSKEPSTDTPGG